MKFTKSTGGNSKYFWALIFLSTACFFAATIIMHVAELPLFVLFCAGLFLLLPCRYFLVPVIIATIAAYSQMSSYADYSGWVYLTTFFRNFIFYNCVLLIYEHASLSRGLGRWQSLAIVGVWVILAANGHYFAIAVLLLSIVIAYLVSFAIVSYSIEVKINRFLGFLLGSMAVQLNGSSGSSVLIWLLPLMPLALDKLAILLTRLLLKQSSCATSVLKRVEIVGGPQSLRNAILVLSMGWCGVIAWWALNTENNAFVTIALAGFPLLFAILVLSVSDSYKSPSKTLQVVPESLSSPRILGLDGLRAIAVMLVILSHAGLMESDFWIRIGGAAVLNAQAGVQIFFVLSGFLITHLLLVEHENTNRVNLLNFYIRRMLRIFPVYYAAIAVSFALSASFLYPIKTGAFLFASGYLMNFASWDNMESTFSHFWSLAVEEHFYFLWPIAIVLAKGKKRVAGAVTLLGIISVVWWVHSPPDWLFQFSVTHAVNRWTIPAVLPILVGCLAAILLSSCRLSLRAASALGLTGALVFVSPLFFSMFEDAPVFIKGLCSSIAIAAVISYVWINQNAVLVRVLENRVLVYIGTISYGLYVWQGILTGNGPYRQLAYWPPDPLIGVVATFVVAILSYHFFERPILRWKAKLTCSSSRTRV